MKIVVKYITRTSVFNGRAVIFRYQKPLQCKYKIVTFGFVFDDYGFFLDVLCTEITFIIAISYRFLVPSVAFVCKICRFRVMVVKPTVAQGIDLFFIYLFLQKSWKIK